MKIQTDVKAGIRAHIIDIGQAKENVMKVQTDVTAGIRAHVIEIG